MWVAGKSGDGIVRAVRGGSCDLDGDNSLNDGDNSGIPGDNPCIGGQIGNCDDNCPNQPNGELRGTCVHMISGIFIGTDVTCSDYDDCAADEYCDMVQGDCNNNGTGDACECYADVNCSTKVDLSDLVIMKGEFLQSCPCQADCNGDNQVNLGDLVIMKMQFLRTGCPMCP